MSRRSVGGSGVPSRAELESARVLDIADLRLIGKASWTIAIVWGSVSVWSVVTFFTDRLGVPQVVVDYVGAQLDVADRCERRRN